MHFLRSITGLLCLLLAALAVAAAIHPMRSELRAVMQSWPNIDTPPEVVAGEESPSDLDVTVQSPLAQLLEAATRLVGWFILAAVLLANATLLGLVNVLDRG